MKTRSWLLTMMLMFVCLLGLTLQPTDAAEPVIVESGTCGAEDDNLTWTLDELGTLTISGTGKMADYGMVSPNAPWNSFKSSIKSIVISDGVTHIGDYAFNGCNEVTNIAIPASMTSIGYWAFFCRSELIDVHITDIAAWCSITFAGTFSNPLSSDPLIETRNLYLNGELVTELVIPDGVTSIENEAFRECNSLTSVVLPENLTSIGSYAFYQCYNLKTVTVLGKLESIDTYAFAVCPLWHVLFTGDETDWDEIQIEQHNEKFTNAKRHFNWTDDEAIDREAENCNICDTEVVASGTCGYNLTWELDANGTLTISGTGKMKDYNWESSSTPWGNHKPSIKRVILSDGVLSIGNYAFNGCVKLTDVSIPDSVTRIGDNAFYECSKLTNMALSNRVIQIGKYAFCGCNLTNITIPDNMTYIADGVFSTCPLTSITIPDGVTYIGADAFAGCSLTSVIIPDGVAEIGANAFAFCRDLISITIPDSVTSIGASAFHGCGSLQSITIPNNLSSIGNNAFTDCTILRAVHITDITAWCNISFEEVNSNPLHNYNALLYLNGQPVTDLTIPDGTTKIGNFAFYGYEKLNSIKIPGSVTSIGNCAFSHCSSLTDIIIPSNVTRIESGTFLGCRNLQAITLPDSVTSIGASAFYDCNSLQSIIIPDSVTSIERSTFSGCENLQSITLPDGLTSIGASAFYGCNSLQSIIIPDTVTSIGEYAFRYCTSLWHVLYKGSKENWSSITINFSNDPLSDAIRHYNCTGDEEIDPVKEYCSICELSAPGDLNGDNEVTDADAIYLLYATFDPVNYPLPQDADYNGDGEITDADAIYLLYATFDPVGYPLS